MIYNHDAFKYKKYCRLTGFYCGRAGNICNNCQNCTIPLLYREKILSEEYRAETKKIEEETKKIEEEKDYANVFTDDEKMILICMGIIVLVFIFISILW